MLQLRFMTFRARYLLAAGFLSAAAAGAQTAGEPPQDTVWSADAGAGQLTDPGPSRRLPPVERLEDPPSATSPALRDHSGRPLASRPPATEKRWWDEDAESTVGRPERALESRSVSPRGEIVLSGQILATVGTQPILAGELLGRVNELLAPYTDRLSEDELQAQRWLLMQKMLPSAIEAKLVYQDFLRTIPEKQVGVIRSNVYEQFDKNQLPSLVERAKVASAADLDAKMRSLGSSLDNTRLAFFEQVAAREMIRRQTEQEQEVTHDELLQYYHEHLPDYELQSKARWEELMTRFDEFDSKEEAYQAIAKMGNAVLNGAPLDVVARRDSQGPTAHEGGQYDWTTKGSLVSEVIDQAIFRLPVGKLSRILEDHKGFHIVRVIQRKEAGRVPFQADATRDSRQDQGTTPRRKGQTVPGTAETRDLRLEFLPAGRGRQPRRPRTRRRATVATFSRGKAVKRTAKSLSSPGFLRLDVYSAPAASPRFITLLAQR